MISSVTGENQNSRQMQQLGIVVPGNFDRCVLRLAKTDHAWLFVHELFLGGG
jgi:hypothetical protein